jgi:triphosphatase
LRKRGFTCRIRKIGESWVQTIKAERRSTAGLFDREEWESALSGEDIDYLAIAATGLAHTLDMQALIGKLEPIFETHIERTSWPMFLDDSEMEVALDKGTIKSGNATVEITELELDRAAFDRRLPHSRLERPVLCSLSIYGSVCGSRMQFGMPVCS